MQKAMLSNISTLIKSVSFYEEFEIKMRFCSGILHFEKKKLLKSISKTYFDILKFYQLLSLRREFIFLALYMAIVGVQKAK